ncbi:VacJ family lipoprotein [Aestuariibacter sp. AA17]|uniref:VacJ family lipoprotein n=1 Tax=Fluctibacter corallii TaxID=2984329 RepID=A0ABT3A6A5_9ALTE|nr:VacJ family lipoprotein [Aestuariibacter sp. AA17]MCV2884196.1 VacJ family lipoprotein [Aestuariibacter sp. AA17]
MLNIIWRSQCRFLFSLCLVLLITGCASQPDMQISPQQQSDLSDPLVVESSHGTAVIEPTVVGYEDTAYDDPLEFINRPIFTFNDYLYRYALIPIGKGYNWVMPDAAKDNVSNFFNNLGEPLSALNHALQGEGKKTGKNVGRFLINSTVGLLGFFDPAKHWFDIEEEDTNLDKTLRHYDVGYGAFLVLPVLGQSDVRNLFSTVAESPLAPIRHVTDEPQTTYYLSWEAIHSFSGRAELYEKLRNESDDPYAFFRNLYMQDLLRDKQYPTSPASINKLRKEKKDDANE